MKKLHTNQEGKYELHITLTKAVELEGWKSSAIDGDPLLGDGVKHYLTTYTSDEETARKKLWNGLWELADRGLRLTVLRAKIEHIIYDVRFSKINEKKR